DHHDQPQVGLDERALRAHVAGLDATSQLHLFSLGQQPDLADLGEVEAQRVLVPARRWIDGESGPQHAALLARVRERTVTWLPAFRLNAHVCLLSELIAPAVAGPGRFLSAPGGASQVARGVR